MTARSIAIAIAMFVAAVLLPTTPAHATYGPPQQVYLQLISNDGQGLYLARAEGTVAFDDGNRRYTYSVSVCWQNAYPSPNLNVYVNDVWQNVWPTSGPTAPGCQGSLSVYSANDVDHGDTVRNIRFELTGGWFDRQGQYRSRTKSTPYYDNPFN